MLVISVVAHVDHGKTTLLDNILSFTRTISPISAGTLRYLDSRIDEQERGITLKLSFFQAENYIFIDTPGHIDFESLIECSSFLCDSFIFIVDVNEGITPRTLSLLNWMKNKNCILVLNKIDKMVNKEVYMVTSQIIESMNVFLEEEYFVWEKNNIIISSSLSLYGLNFDKFKILKENNTLKDALAFIFLLSDDTEEIKREKLLKLLKSKNIHTTEIKKIFPLSHTLLNSLKAIELGFVRNIDNERKKIVKLFQEDFISQKRDYEPQLEDLTSQLEDLESQKKEHEP
ncbi:Translation elongation factor 2/ribosome biogenesis protein RIA1, partial [Pseudoloma neurophilia]